MQNITRSKKITINDTMQQGYYYLSEPTSKSFDPEFKPELSPKEMLELGIFGGNYKNNVSNYSSILCKNLGFLYLVEQSG